MQCESVLFYMSTFLFNVTMILHHSVVMQGFTILKYMALQVVLFFMDIFYMLYGYVKGK